MPRYWVFVEDEVKGPFPPKEIKQREDFSELLVCEEDSGDENWTPAIDVPELAPTKKRDESKKTSSSESLIEGTRRNVTILFADLSGFTRMTEELGDEEAHRITNEVFDQLVPCVKQHGGTIDKYIGDEIMALFGVEESHEDDPERAVVSALRMIDQLNEYNENNGMDLSLHVGVNTGKVVASETDTTDDTQFSVTGSGVNIAEILTDEAGDDSVFISPATQKRLRGRFNLRPVPGVEINSLDQDVEAFEVTGRKTTDETIADTKKEPSVIETDENPTMSFVNREHEIQQLQAVLEEDGNPVAGLISGPGGVGKTRLIAHFFGNEAPVDVESLTIQGDPYSERLPFSTSLPAFDRAIGARNPSDRPRTREELVEFVAENHDVFESLELVYGIGADTQSLNEAGGMERNPSEEENGREASEAMMADLADFLRNQLSEQNIVLAVDDAQWADPRTLSLLSTLIKRQSGTKTQLPIVMDSRPSGINADPEQIKKIDGEATRTNMYVDDKRTDSSREGPPLRDIIKLDEEVVHLDLAPLSEDLIRSIVKDTFPGAEIPEGFVESVEERTGGLAIHIEQVLRSLRDRGRISRENDRWVIDEQARKVPMPETLQDLIGSRVDQLDDAPRQILLVSSVLGVNFESWLIESVTDQPPDVLEDSIDHLLNRGFLRTRKDEYIFQHSTIQEVTYDMLLDKDRKKYHARAANALNERLSLDNPETRDRLASHYRGAEAWENLFKLRVQGIEQALRNYSFEDADRIASEILDFNWEETLNEHWSARFLYALGRLRIKQFEYKEAKKYLQRSINIIDEDRDKQSLAMKHGTLGKAYEKTYDYDQAETHIEAALELDREIGNKMGEGMRLGSLGRVKMKQDQYEEAFELTMEALKIDRDLNNRKGESIQLSTLGEIEEEQGNLESARDFYEQSLEIARAMDNYQGQSITLGKMGRVCEQLDEYREATLYYEEALDLDRERDNDYGVAYHLGGLGRVAEKTGQLDKAKNYVQQALDVQKALGNDSSQAYQLSTLARLARKNNQYARAIELIDRALELDRSRNDTRGEAKRLNSRGWIHEDAGNFQQALEDYRQALALHEEINNQRGQERIHSSIGKLMESFGRWSLAEQHHGTGLEINREIDNPAGAVTSLSGLRRVAVEQRDLDGAEEFAREALEINRDIDNQGGEALQESAIARIYLYRNDTSKAQEWNQRALDRASDAEDTTSQLFTHRVQALIDAKNGDMSSAVDRLSQAGSLYNRDMTWLKPTLENTGLPDALYYPILPVLVTYARCFREAGQNGTALNVTEHIIETVKIPPESTEQLQYLAEAELVRGRLTGDNFDEPWDLVKQHLGDFYELEQSLESGDGQADEGWFNSTVKSVSSLFGGDDDNGEKSRRWELVDPNYKTEIKDDDGHGESLLVLVNLDEESTNKIIGKLPAPTSDPFRSQYDTRYQFGFFITAPSDETIDVLEDQFETYFG